MKSKILPLVVAGICSIAWIFVEAIAPSRTGLLGVLLISLWFDWIALSFYKDRDLPMMGFGFDSGSNQSGRYLAAYGMTCTFLWLVISDLQKLI